MSIWVNAYTMPVAGANQGYSALKTIFKGDRPYIVPRRASGALLQHDYTDCVPDAVILDSALTVKAPDLSELMHQSAERVLKQFAMEPVGSRLYVWWSGGLDSTSIVLELLQHTLFKVLLDEGRAFIVCDERSVEEYPRMYAETIESLPRVQSDLGLYMEPGSCHVDGIWADELFGNYQAEHYPDGATAPAGTLRRQVRGLLTWPGIIDQFLTQAADLESEFPAETLFQRLWWLEFSLSYQDAVLRPYYNGSNTKKSAEVAERFAAGMRYRWFAHPSWTPWAMQRQLHNRFENYRASKLELRKFILERNNDQDYYDNKPKVYSQGAMYFNWKNGITNYFACY